MVARIIFMRKISLISYEKSQRVEKIEDAIDHSGWNVSWNVGIQIKRIGNARAKRH
jgi:hypothetical protein